MRVEQEQFTHDLLPEFGPGGVARGTRQVTIFEGAEDHRNLDRHIDAAITNILNRIKEHKDDLENFNKKALNRKRKYNKWRENLPWFKRWFTPVKSKQDFYEDHVTYFALENEIISENGLLLKMLKLKDKLEMFRSAPELFYFKTPGTKIGDEIALAASQQSDE